MSVFVVLSSFIGFFLIVGLFLIVVHLFPRVIAVVAAWFFGGGLLVPYLRSILEVEGSDPALTIFTGLALAFLAILSIIMVVYDLVFLGENRKNLRRFCNEFLK